MHRCHATAVALVLVFAAGCTSSTSSEEESPSSVATANPDATVAPSAAPTASPTPTRDPTPTASEPSAAAGIPDGWETTQGDGFEVSYPPDWSPDTGRGDQDVNVEAPGEGSPPLVGVTAQPSSGAGARGLLEIFAGSIAGSVEDFTEVEAVAIDLAGAQEAVRMEATYGLPDGRVVHEYLVIGSGDGIDLAVRAASLEDDWDDAREVLARIVASVRLVPGSLPTPSSPPSG